MFRRIAPPLAATLFLAACATRPPAPEPSAPLTPPPAEVPLSAIHQGLGPLEQVWHIRAGLNVAALSCAPHVGPEIVSDYNRFLAAKQPLLARAFAAKEARFDHPRALDSNMTRLYNHFASPPAQPAFCAAAAQEMKRALAEDAARLEADPGPMLARLDRPIAMPTPVARAAPLAIASAPTASLAAVPSGDWRIQLGAFGTPEAARRAWTLLVSRTASLGSRKPHYEPVPGRPLTRLQLRDVASRADAIKLCAHAAAVGFDCFPVAAR